MPPPSKILSDLDGLLKKIDADTFRTNNADILKLGQLTNVGDAIPNGDLTRLFVDAYPRALGKLVDAASRGPATTRTTALFVLAAIASAGPIAEKLVKTHSVVEAVTADVPANDVRALASSATTFFMSLTFHPFGMPALCRSKGALNLCLVAVADPEEHLEMAALNLLPLYANVRMGQELLLAESPRVSKAFLKAVRAAKSETAVRQLMTAFNRLLKEPAIRQRFCPSAIEACVCVVSKRDNVDWRAHGWETLIRVADAGDAARKLIVDEPGLVQKAIVAARQDGTQTQEVVVMFLSALVDSHSVRVQLVEIKGFLGFLANMAAAGRSREVKSYALLALAIFCESREYKLVLARNVGVMDAFVLYTKCDVPNLSSSSLLAVLGIINDEASCKEIRRNPALTARVVRSLLVAKGRNFVMPFMPGGDGEVSRLPMNVAEYALLLLDDQWSRLDNQRGGRGGGEAELALVRKMLMGMW